MGNVVEIKKLNKSYSNFSLSDINLTIPEGIIMGLIGENGAGKTTLIKSILNIVNVSGKNIKIFNKDSAKEERILKEDIGVVLDNSFFPELLMAKDINIIMKNTYKNWDESLFNDYLMKFKLPQNKSIKTLSKGMRKKLEILTALSHKPRLLILDEPTSGLDPVVRSEILDIFEEFVQDGKHTILLSTHITSDLEHIADNITFIDNGKIVFSEKKIDILNTYGLVRCSLKEYENINKIDIIKYKKHKDSYELLINDKKEFKKKYKNIEVTKERINFKRFITYEK